jgi:acylphosphatase
MLTRTVHVRVEGRVQGVGYRAYVEMNAAQLNIDGWVRNRCDGSVEAVFQGSDAAVEEVLRLCAIGPAAARVDRVEEIGEADGSFAGFEVRTTA